MTRIFFATKRIELQGTREQETQWAEMQRRVDELNIEVHENHAGVAELVDAPDLESGGLNARGGSTPPSGTH